MTTIHIVFGETGEYDSQIEWPACAYYSRDKAERHAILAEEWARKFLAQLPDKDRNYPGILRALSENKNPYDPGMGMDRETGTNYSVIECDLRHEVPAAPEKNKPIGEY